MTRLYLFYLLFDLISIVAYPFVFVAYRLRKAKGVK